MTKILESKEYEKFRFLPFNRPISQRKIDTLVKRMEKHGFLPGTPVVVNRSFEILFGQHRFSAARQLQIPFFYVVDEKPRTIEEEIRLVADESSAADTWKNRQYLNAFSFEGFEGNEHYDAIREFMKKNYVSLSAVFTMMYAFENGQFKGHNGSWVGAHYDRTINETFRSGDFVFKPYVSQCGMIMARINDIRKASPNYDSFCFSKPFTLALLNFVTHSKYDHGQMMTKLKQVPSFIESTSSSREYSKMLDKVYNYRMKKARVY
jgi:ParB-like nuclease domain